MRQPVAQALMPAASRLIGTLAGHAQFARFVTVQGVAALPPARLRLPSPEDARPVR